MSILNTIVATATEHPFLSILAVVVGARLLLGHVLNARAFVRHHTAKNLEPLTWNGIERRGPNRAKNVVRPTFGVSKTGAPVEVEEKKTGTKG